MSGEDRVGLADAGEGARAERLSALAGHLGIELPVFDAPLVAFQLERHRGADDPVFLGGDLHAVHPAAQEHHPCGRRDPTLDSAIVTISDHEHEMLDLPAVGAIWCGRIAGERLPAAPFLSVTDTEARIRA